MNGMKINLSMHASSFDTEEDDAYNTDMDQQSITTADSFDLDNFMFDE